jgi:hypothetical protein
MPAVRLGGPACFSDGLPLDGAGGCVDVGFWAYRATTNQTIAPTVETVVNLTNKADESPVGVFNLTTDTFTAPITGRYVFSASVELVTAAAGSAYLRIYIGGTYRWGASDQSSLATTLTPCLSLVTWMTSGTTAQIRIYQNTGFNATLIGCCNQSGFSGALICAP